MLNLPDIGQVQYDVVSMAGGFDQVTSSYQLNPGAMRDCLNYACRPTGGYYRVPGYERFDGRAQPHRAEFLPIDVTLLDSPVLAVGMTGTFGNIPGSVAYIDPFRRYVIVTKSVALSTVFVPGPILISAVNYGQANDYFAGLTIENIAVAKAAAANIYRADIQPVPGSGPIRGVTYFKDVAYAFRDNVGGTACDIHKSTGTGWAQVALGLTIPFSNASAMPTAEGTTLTQGGVTATIDRWAITSGDLTGGTAAGYFVIHGVTGGSFAAGAATTNAGVITLAGGATQITLSPGGTYEFNIGNFTGSSATERIYGVDGVNNAFEFDGMVYTPIVVPGMTTKPTCLAIHALHLFLGFGGSAVHSGLGLPYNFEVVNGAGEIAVGNDITNFLILTGSDGGGALEILAKNNTCILYGTSSADWKLVSYNAGVGGWPRTAQNLFDGFALDDRGVIMMKQSLNYGNFDAATLTYNIRPFVQAHRGMSVCSGLNRENGQYRVFFSDGYGLYCTVSPQGFVGSGLVLFPKAPTCYFDGEDSTGDTYALFGTADGYVMRNDVGTSFDGASISAYLNTNINSSKSPRLRKRYRKCALEIQGDAYVDLSVGYSFEWSSAKVLPHEFVSGDAQFSPLVYWDNFFWDAFFWDGRGDDAINVELSGTGENLQMILFSDSDHTAEFTVVSAIFHFSPRRGNR